MSSTRFGTAAVSTSWPSGVTSTSSSMRTPMPCHAGSMSVRWSAMYSPGSMVSTMPGSSGARGVALLVEADVVHVHAEPVAGAVHVHRLVELLLDDLVGAAPAACRARAGRPTSVRTARWCGSSKRAPGAHRVDRGELRGEHQLVDRALATREAGADREGARHVGAVEVVLGAGVDEQQVVRLEPAVVGRVVQDGGVGAAGDDRRVGGAGGAVAAEDVVDQRLDLVLPAPGARLTHGGDDAPRRRWRWRGACARAPPAACAGASRARAGARRAGRSVPRPVRGRVSCACSSQPITRRVNASSRSIA